MSISLSPRRLQSMMFSLQRYTFCVEYRKGFSLYLADALSRGPLPTKNHFKSMMSWSTESSLSPIILTSRPSTMLSFRTSELQLVQIQNKSFSALCLAQGGLMTRLLSQRWLDHIGLLVMNSLFMMACYSSMIASSSPPPFVNTPYANSMQLIVALSLLFVMLADLCSGLALTAKSQTYVNLASFVLDMYINIPASHSNPIQYLLYHGNWCPRTCSNLMV